MSRLLGFFLLTLILVLAPVGLRSVGAQGFVVNEDILVRFSNGNDVFSPYEVITLEILPRSPRIAAEKLNLLTVSLHRTNESVGTVRTPGKKSLDDSTRLTATELEIFVPNAPQAVQWIPVSLIMPANEGVYEIGVSFQRKGEPSSGYNLLANPLQRRPAKIFLQTVVSCVVVNSTALQRPVGELQIAVDTEQPETVDTTNPAWWKRFTKVPALPKVASLPKIPGLRSVGSSSNPGNPPLEIERLPIRSGPMVELLEQWKVHGENSFGSGHFKEQTTIPMIATPLSALSAPDSSDAVPWEAIPLSIKEPGKPHLLELEYPSNVPQTLGITVVELIPSDNGMVPTVSVESGIDVAEEIVSDSKTNRLLKHRIVFWPKTKSPMLLLTNRRPSREAVFGKVNTFRLADAPDRLAQPFDGEPQRLLAGYVHRPDFFNSLASSVGAADWEVLYEGATRFTDLLRHGGYDGTMLVVAADGKTLYPSTNLGRAAGAGPLVGVDNRPVSKDVLELLARLFDRDGLTLIPAIDFNSPLPVLEAAIQRNPNLAVELSWIGPNGPVFLPSDRSGSVSGPYYNLLHPSVQDAMIDSVKELASRYARHPSFGGVSVLLSPDGFAQIPDPFWGIDDVTIAQFQRETDVKLPEGVGVPTENFSSNRFAARVQYFQTNAAGFETWIRWRTLKVNEFYRRIAQTLTEIRPDATLYLAGGTMLDSPNMQQYCSPSLLRRTTLTQALRLTGFDPALYTDSSSLVFLRPSRPEAAGARNTATYRELESTEYGTATRDAVAAGALLFHESPPNEKVVIVPGDARNRRRFVQRLAQEDVLTFFDGGDALPLGEEEAFYSLAAAFRQLPKAPFQTFVAKDFGKNSSKTDGDQEKTLQPVTVRFLETSSGLFVYLLNDAPFGVDAKLTFSVSPTVPMEELSGRRPINAAFLKRKDGQLSWLASLQPYDLVAVRLAEPTASLVDAEIYRPMEICGPNGTLKRKIDELGERIQAARNGVPWNKLENPGCELMVDATTELVGWTRYGGEHFVAVHDSATKNSGNASLKLESKAATSEPDAVSSNIVSNNIVFSNIVSAPETGRLFVSAFLGVSNQSAAPTVNVLLTAKHRETPLYRSFAIEPTIEPSPSLSPSPGPSPTGSVRWRKVVVPFDRLPQDSLDELRIGFELTGPGTVWIDDVMLYQVAFTKEEQMELFKRVSVADFRRSTDRISDLLSLMDGYWPRFLLEHVPSPAPAPPPMVAAEHRPAYTENRAVTPPPKPVEPSKPESSGFFGRFKGWFSK